MRKIFTLAALYVVFAVTVLAQDTPCTAKFPFGLDSLDSLCRTVNNGRTSLNGGISNSQTTITVDSTANFDTSGLIVIGSVNSEIAFYTSKTATTFNGVLRGQDGTNALAHPSGAVVRAAIARAHIQTHARAIEAIEAKIGPGATTRVPNAILQVQPDGVTTEWTPNPNLAGAVGTAVTGSGASSAGSITLNADNDANGSGIISLQTGGVEYLSLVKDYIAGRGIETATGAITLRQAGGVPNDGLNDSAAFVNAIAIAKTPNRPKTVQVSGGTFDILTTATVNFGLSYDIAIRGDGSGGAIRNNVGEANDGIVFNGGNSILLQNLAIIGTQGQTSARHAIKFVDTLGAKLEHVYAYGLTTKGNNIEAVSSFLDVDQSEFLGCSADGANGFGVISCTNWRGCRVTRSHFYDQGTFNADAAQHMNVLNATAFWVKAHRPHSTLREAIVGNTQGSQSGAKSQGVFFIEGNDMDEGAQYAVITFSDVAGGAPPIEHVRIQYNRVNVTNAAGGGVNIEGTRKVYIGWNYFGYTYIGDTNAVLLAGAGDVTLDNNLMEQRAKQIAVINPIGGTTDRITIIDGSYSGIFIQPASVLLDIQRASKRKIKTYTTGTHTYADLTPVHDLEVPTSISIGGDAVWTKGAGAPSNPCVPGRYTRTDMGPGIPGEYICVNFEWVAQ